MNNDSVSSRDLCHSVRLLTRKNASERGVALIITLLMLGLVTALSLGMVIAFSSQTLIGGYYRNYRGAFYAADSGLNIARDQVTSQLQAATPIKTYTANSCPSTGSATVATTYANPTSLNTGTAATSWHESFQITNATLGSPTILPGTNTYSCLYPYSITSVGTAQGSEQQTITETGDITITVTGGATPTALSFAYYGAFIDQYPIGTGPLVPGTMTGPMFTNGAWEFMANQAPWTSPYVFTDPVQQAGPQADYWDTSWNQHLSSASSWGSGSNLIDPDFEQGFEVSQPLVQLPANAFNQEEAVIDGNGALWPAGTTAAQATATLQSANLQTVAGTIYNGTTATTPGVYFNKGTSAYGTPPASGSTSTTSNCPSGVTPPCVAGGGFFVQGDSNVELVPVSGSSTAQTYIITPASGGATTTITTDPAANNGMGSTVITSGGISTTYNGVPMDTVTGQASTMMYVNGNMTFQGPGEGQGAIQDNTMITLTAAGNAIATGDVLYKTEPVTIPTDTLIPAVANMNQVLGIYTANGNFITQDTQADQNIEVDGSIATISQSDSANCNGSDGGQTSNGHINTFNNVGGMIQSCMYSADINTENTWFDRRFTSRPGFAPPWFPSTNVTLGGTSGPTVISQFQRIQWLSTSSQ